MKERPSTVGKRRRRGKIRRVRDETFRQKDDDFIVIQTFYEEKEDSMWKKSKSFFSICLVFFFLMVGFGGEAQSQPKYPTRAISMIVPYAAGGTLDRVTRLGCMYMSEKLGVPVNVVNKPGGNCIPGILEVMSSAPDGYTLLAENPASTSILVLHKDLPFEIMNRSFINILTNAPQVFIVSGSSPYHTLDDLAKAVKKNPETLTWASPGSTSHPSMVARQFFSALGVDGSKTREIPAKGGSENIIQVAGGHVAMTILSPPSSLPVIKAGSARALAVTSEGRCPMLPNVPTTRELGYPSVNGLYWHGYSGPPNLPSYVVDTWNQTWKKAIKDPEFISRLDKVGTYIYYRNPAETREVVLKEIEEVKKLWGVK